MKTQNKILAGALALALASPAIAQNWDEATDGGGDAGIQNAAQAVSLPTGFTTISGSINTGGGDHVDCYQFTVQDVASFYATTDPSIDPNAVVGDTDTRLWLWDASGTTIISGNDDSPGQPGLLSVISDPSGPIVYPAVPTNPVTTSLVDGGDYVLCYSYFANDPDDAAGEELVNLGTFEALNGPDPAAGPFASYENPNNEGQLNYTIAFAGTEVVFGTDPIARFQVIKDFDDDNTASVDVEISCNTGLPISQPGTVEEGDPITFVVTDFNDGELNCTITETGVAGYTASYDNGTVVSETSCDFTGVLFEQFNTCTITNSLNPVTVEVTKWWMDENPANNPINYAEADYSCANEAFGDASGTLEFLGDGAVDSFTVFPAWDGSTTCSVTETVVDNGVEFDDSECASLSVTPGNGASCNIYNTRLFEGIPTLSQYGLAIMALLMLGVGFVAFRRIA